MVKLCPSAASPSLPLLLVAGCLLLGSTGASRCTIRSGADRPTVDLGYEVHQGTLNETADYYAFTNIPYAEQPVGDLRFQKPVSINRTGSEVNDGADEVKCPQAYPRWLVEIYAGSTDEAAVAAMADTLLNQTGQTESCLALDVYVPTGIFNAGAVAQAPVLVYIHGGGFTEGWKTADGNPVALLSRSRVGGDSGAIVVAINYRLGLFGWLAGDDITPNLGLHDQRMALEWVQQYIGRFGGSADRVTVMGESAGASSIVHHITAYGGAVDAPFQSAIPLSPAFQFNIDLDAAYERTLQVASAQSNVSIGSAASLTDLDFDVLSSINQAVVYPASVGFFNYGVGPDGSYVPEIPQILLRQGRFNAGINMLISHTSNESIPFSDTSISTAADVLAKVRSSFPEASNATLATLLTDIYPDVLDGRYPWTSSFGRAAQIATDSSFSCMTNYLATAFLGAGANTHNYVFAYPPAYHAGDLSYVFFDGDTTALDDGYPVDADIAVAMQDFILAFARTGDPGLGDDTFPVYGEEGNVLWITDEGLSRGIDDVKNERCAWIWQALVDGRL
ncbi:carboxylesterase [Xylariomycetidae sp. FL2044]|nr:carboxylesterase [Xylariomycetidae sp. FL2044]